MSRAIHTEALIANVHNLADRADELLAMQGDAAYPGLVSELSTLGRDIHEQSFELAHAVTALHILETLSHRLARRAWACAEVCGTTLPDEDIFGVTTRVGARLFGERFVNSVISDEDVPF